MNKVNIVTVVEASHVLSNIITFDIRKVPKDNTYLDDVLAVLQDPDLDGWADEDCNFIVHPDHPDLADIKKAEVRLPANVDATIILHVIVYET